MTPPTRYDESAYTALGHTESIHTPTANSWWPAEEPNPSSGSRKASRDTCHWIPDDRTSKISDAVFDGMHDSRRMEHLMRTKLKPYNTCTTINFNFISSCVSAKYSATPYGIATQSSLVGLYMYPIQAQTQQKCALLLIPRKTGVGWR